MAVRVAALIAPALYAGATTPTARTRAAPTNARPIGEFLDHGLDKLNTVYIGLSDGVWRSARPPIWWVVITLLIPGAAGVAYWEQSNTGVISSRPA